MKIGFNLLLWTTHVTDADAGVLEQLKAAGYDGVEVPVFEGDEAHYAALKARLDGLGLDSTVVAIVQDEARNPMSDDPASRQAGIDYLKWLVDCSAALGAEVLCGPFYQPLGVFSGTGPTPDEWQRMVEAHRAMASHAAGAGLTIAVEPLNRFECYALNTAERAAALADAVGADQYGYLYDTFHANIEEKDPVGVIAETAGRIAHVHISENDRGTPGRGHIDFQATFDALRRAGYDGWLTVEAFGHALPDIAAATKVWRPLFGSEEQVFSEAIDLIRRGWAAAEHNA
ncbi:sugar phosphate isomerase/epimerase family protein [Roseitalea porphyridii]|uniref:Sugar phosphate isomerase/epimerase n=1 Tax=Roseitalea porphyridii TaxID=1852022 RepID=A0A4P6V0W4_9HYPH|nr:sugar phosphate isomerase/epimerase [Roseitalea porphyridii]QBK31047.1 sugar phosphate isomerase/epimerase [Roseitalea porphyridii]